MRAELTNLNHCAVPSLSRAAVNLSWYDNTKDRSLDRKRIVLNSTATMNSCKPVLLL